MFSLPVAAQETDIVPYLKMIEEGKQDEVVAKMPDLKKQHPGDPSIMFLEAVLTTEPDNALPLFNTVIEKYPRSRYADASVYRVYSYYFALGLYSTAEKHLEHLKKEYTDSPYIKLAERNIPDTDEKSEIATQEPVVQSNEEKSDLQYHFTIQAGAFSNKKNSNALVEQFRTAGYDTQIKEKLVGGTSFDIVYVGKFANENEAREFLKIINDRYKLDGRVVGINNDH